MTVCSDIADYIWITGEEAAALLEELNAEHVPLHTVIDRLRGRYSRERTHLIVEQLELRSRAAAKFTRAARMFFTRTGLEQATDEWVAGYKAARFAQFASVADLCCGIGGDLLGLTRATAAVGVDRDPVAAHFAAINSGATVRCTDAVQFDLSGFAAWHIDPDRRSGGRRTTSLAFCEPPLAALDQLLARVPHAAVKLAPATVVPPLWAERCELEWISRDRECRQLVAWHGALAQSAGQRSATVLPTACGLAPRTVTGAPNQPIAIAAQPDRYVFDIDPAVLAANLKGALAAEHGLTALSDGPTHLTGPRPVTDAALAAFEVTDVLPLHTRKLARHLRERHIGQLEIKKRGVEVDPDRLRRALNLRGEGSATLLITHVANRPAAILAHRVVEIGDRSKYRVGSAKGSIVSR